MRRGRDLRSTIVVTATFALGLLVGGCSSEPGPASCEGSACEGTSGGTTPPPSSTGSSGTSNGGAQGSTPATSGAPPLTGCRTITVDPKSVNFHDGGFWGKATFGAVAPDLGGGGYQFFALRLPDESMTPGTYDLGSGANHDYNTCKQCAMVCENVWGDNVNELNFQYSGSLTIETFDPATSESSGKLQNVVFQKVEQTGFFQWGAYASTPHCLELAELSWDTRAVEKPCAKSSDCPNEVLQRCDVQKKLCVRK